MPYCISDWFSECLLSKASSVWYAVTPFELVYAETIPYSQGSWHYDEEFVSAWPDNYVNYFREVKVPSWDITIYMYWYNWQSIPWGTYWYKAFLWDTELMSCSYWGTTTQTINVSWGTLKLGMLYNRYGWTFTFRVKYKISKTISELYKETTGYLPRNVANLWENAAVTTFGRHIDGTRITHE